MMFYTLWCQNKKQKYAIHKKNFMITLLKYKHVSTCVLS